MSIREIARPAIFALSALAYGILGEVGFARADFMFTVTAEDPKIVDEGAHADITFTIKLMQTNESVLVSRISPNFMFDSGPDQTDMPVSAAVARNSPTKAGDTLTRAGDYSFVVRVETAPWDGPNGDDGVFDAAKWRIFAPVVLLGLTSLNSSEEEGTAFLTIKDSRANPAPEPSTLALGGIGFLGAYGLRVRSRSRMSLILSLFALGAQRKT
jgi:hypothetical protein